jgi:hypothetical protein
MVCELQWAGANNAAVRGAVVVEWLVGLRRCGCLHQHDTKLAVSKKEDDGK